MMFPDPRRVRVAEFQQDGGDGNTWLHHPMHHFGLCLTVFNTN